MTDTAVLSEVYGKATFQGEGPFQGRRCTFVRFARCNLHCRWCDTPFTWDWKGRNGVRYDPTVETFTADLADVASAVAALDVRLCIITGGEPLIQDEAVATLAATLRPRGVDCHVETNGTLIPHASSRHVAHYVVSPKLRDAEAGSRAYSPDALAYLGQMARLGKASFKFVVSHLHQMAEVAGIVDEAGLPASTVWIMPEGVTARDVNDGLANLAETVLDYGYNLSGRLHVQLWGQERGR